MIMTLMESSAKKTDIVLVLGLVLVLLVLLLAVLPGIHSTVTYGEDIGNYYL
jgi:hypothetical protein